MFKTRQSTQGQALVEFALAATLIFVLLSAAIDLGLIFFRHQGLYNASLEGASYGSRFVKTFTAAEIAGWSDEERMQRGCAVPNAVQAVCIDKQEVIQRIITEDGSGSGGGTGLVNLKDLNADGIPDDAAVQSEYITVKAVTDETNPDDPNLACADITHPPPSVTNCYIYVKLKSDYHMFFALAPAFGDSITVSASTLYPIRAQVQTNSNAPPGTSASNTPTNTPTNTATPTATQPTDTPTGEPIPPDNGSVTPTSTTADTSNPGGTPGAGGSPQTGDTPGTATATNTPKPTRLPTKTHTPGPSPTRKPTNTRGPTNTPGTPKPTNTRKPTSVGTKVPPSTKPPTGPTRTNTPQGT